MTPRTNKQLQRKEEKIENLDYNFLIGDLNMKVDLP